VNVEALIFQQIVDANFDQSIATASPNNTINVVQIAAKGSGTNIGVAITPKGTGYLSAQLADGTTAGGNARGTRAVDLQMIRASAAHVASGAGSVVIGGTSSAATGDNSFACGSGNNATGAGAVAFGATSVASGTNSFAVNNFNQATGEASAAFGRGSLAHRRGMVTFCAGGFATAGDAQAFNQCVLGKTTTNSGVALTLNGAGTGRITLQTNSVIHAIITIVGSKSDGSAVASYLRQVTIKRVGNTTSLVGTVNTIGTDEAAGTSIAITADDTNDALIITPTGISGETWRWVASVDGAEMVYGT
jgi:hypothetical protein